VRQAVEPLRDAAWGQGSPVFAGEGEPRLGHTAPHCERSSWAFRCVRKTLTWPGPELRSARSSRSSAVSVHLRTGASDRRGTRRSNWHSAPEMEAGVPNMALRYVFGWLSHAAVATSVRR
jgi:hypothetical protein